MIKHCRDCPIMQETDISEYAVTVGCLPTYVDTIKWFNETGKLWACHCKPNEPCAGFLNRLIKEKRTIDFSKELITEETTFEEIYDNN